MTIISPLETEKFVLMPPKYWFPVQLLCSITPTPDQPTLDVHILCIFIQKIFNLLFLIDYTAINNFLVVEMYHS
jgi:hypothetical protein